MTTRREETHRALYRWHADILAGALAIVLKRVNTLLLSSYLVEQASLRTDLTPVNRRRALQGIAYTSIATQLHPADRQTLYEMNGEGWAHATATGQAEAQATPRNGGPPDGAKVAAGVIAATKLIQPSHAASMAADWTDLELRTIAMGAALAAGDGKALGDAARAVKDALVSTDRAMVTYGDLLHQTVTQAYLATTQAANPGALYDFLNSSTPCPTCEELAIEGPYQFVDIPQIPQHPNCVCDYELSKTPVGADALG